MQFYPPVIELLSALPPKTPILLGCSGGRDSVVLAHEFAEKIRSHAWDFQLVLCHLNHGFRGTQSDDDEQLVKNLAEKINCEFFSEKINVAELATHAKKSFEEFARHARHEFFFRCAKHYQSRLLMLAHHAEDQTETILHNLCRGASGLRGMQVVNTIKISDDKALETSEFAGMTLQILRPFLQTSRKAINEAAKLLDFRDDETNFQPVATRNRLRLEVLPKLSEILVRDVVPVINRAEILCREKDEALRYFLSQLQLLDPQNRLYLPTLRPLPRAAQTQILLDFFNSQNVPKISELHLSRCLKLLDSANKISRVSLPGNWTFHRRQARLFLTKNK